MSELDQYRTTLREWLAANLEPRAAVGPRPINLAEQDEMTPERLAAERALQRRIHDAGYAGITWPVEYGGQGLTAAHQKVFDEEARAYVLPDFGIVGAATFKVCAPTMLAHATPELLHEHIPRVLAGDELIVQFFSDPEAGSDLAGVRTQAVRDGDRWILSGSKIWSSGAQYADYGLCLARTDWDVPKHRGLTWFAVPVRAPGVTVTPIRQINGSAEFCQEFFDEVELPDSARVGEVNDGWTVTQTMLRLERSAGGQARPAVPAAPIAPDLVALASEGDRLGDPVVRDLIVRAHVDDVVRGHLHARIAALMAADPTGAGALASFSKLAAGTFDPERANLALQIGGAAAWSDPTSDTARAGARFLNSRFMAIAGGTNEMQRNSIGERVLGLPREPSFDANTPFREVLRKAQNWSGKVG